MLCNPALRWEMWFSSSVIDSSRSTWWNARMFRAQEACMPTFIFNMILLCFQQVEYGILRVQQSLPRLYQLAQGGTAVGTGLNSFEGFDVQIADEVRACVSYMCMCMYACVFACMFVCVPVLCLRMCVCVCKSLLAAHNVCADSARLRAKMPFLIALLICNHTCCVLPLLFCFRLPRRLVCPS